MIKHFNTNTWCKYCFNRIVSIITLDYLTRCNTNTYSDKW